jgi:hypothetical protein
MTGFRDMKMSMHDALNQPGKLQQARSVESVSPFGDRARPTACSDSFAVNVSHHWNFHSVG